MERQRCDLAGARDRLSILAESDVRRWLDHEMAPTIDASTTTRSIRAESSGYPPDTSSLCRRAGINGLRSRRSITQWRRPTDDSHDRHGIGRAMVAPRVLEGSQLSVNDSLLIFLCLPDPLINVRV
jgi:hypothetical protein